MRFHILKVKSGTEFAVEKRLKKKGVHSVIPFEERKWRLANGSERKKPVALLKGYVVAGFKHPPNWHSVFRVDGVIGYLGHDNEPTIIPDAVVDGVRRMGEEVAKANAEFEAKRKLTVGQGARVTQGALVAHHVRIKRIVGKRALVELIQGSRVISVAMADLEAA